LRIASKPHFGGDGMAFWLLDGSQDPTFSTDPAVLNGNLMGMREDFKGVGVAIDVYDNDGKRDNPSIFVLYNPSGAKTEYNHDNDFKDDMYKRTAPSSGANKAFKCTSHIRNTQSNAKIMVKYVSKVMHVYVDSDDGLGYKFCLAVEFDGVFRDHHIAFSGLTGQVADLHNVLELSTRYLDSESAYVDDSNLIASNDKASCGTFWWLISAAIALTGGGLAAYVSYELVTIKSLQSEGIDAVVAAKRINKLVLMHYAVHAGLCAVLLFSGYWITLLINCALLAWRAIEVKNKSYTVSTNDFEDGSTGGFITKQYVSIAVYLSCEIVYIMSWYDC
jgi:Legume-like lectin family/Cornichon protein